MQSQKWINITKIVYGEKVFFPLLYWQSDALTRLYTVNFQWLKKRKKNTPALLWSAAQTGLQPLSCFPHYHSAHQSMVYHSCANFIWNHSSYSSSSYSSSSSSCFLVSETVFWFLWIASNFVNNCFCVSSSCEVKLVAPGTISRYHFHQLSCLHCRLNEWMNSRFFTFSFFLSLLDWELMPLSIWFRKCVLVF